MIVLPNERVDGSQIVPGSRQLTHVRGIDAVITGVHELLERRALIFVRGEFVDESEARVVP
jgi:hypothetical protein